MTQTRSYLLRNNCHRLVELTLNFQKIVVTGDNFTPQVANPIELRAQK